MTYDYYTQWQISQGSKYCLVFLSAHLHLRKHEEYEFPCVFFSISCHYQIDLRQFKCQDFRGISSSTGAVLKSKFHLHTHYVSWLYSILTLVYFTISRIQYLHWVWNTNGGFKSNMQGELVKTSIHHHSPMPTSLCAGDTVLPLITFS